MSEILILCEYATLNGGEQSMLATLDAVVAGGFTPVVASPRVGPLADVLAARGVEHVPFDCRIGDIRVPLEAMREQLADILRQRRSALLHANSLAMGRLAGPVAATLHLPSISHLRDIINLNQQAIGDLNCNRRLLAVSHAVREHHVVRGLSPDKTHVLYNGVDLDKFHPHFPSGFLHRELGLAETQAAEMPLIASVGQIGVRKGQDMLLWAAATLTDYWPNAHYLIIGQRHSEKEESRQYEEELHRAANDMLPGRVHFLGRRDDMADILPELTLLVHPARQEPLGRVLLEAAAAGVAVVATDVGGTCEIFPPELNAARLIPPDDPDQLAAAMLELLDDRPLRVYLSATARHRAEQQFDIRKNAVELVRHYREVLSE
jgi:glycosyltransferase involved in cell wall biosynthesis